MKLKILILASSLFACGCWPTPETFKPTKYPSPKAVKIKVYFLCIGHGRYGWTYKLKSKPEYSEEMQMWVGHVVDGDNIYYDKSSGFLIEREVTKVVVEAE